MKKCTKCKKIYIGEHDMYCINCKYNLEQQGLLKREEIFNF